MSMNEELNMLRVENLMLLGKLKQPQAMRLIQNRAAVLALLQSIGGVVTPNVTNVTRVVASPTKPVVVMPAPVANPSTVAAAMAAGW